MPLSVKTNEAIETIRGMTRRFGKNADPDHAQQSLTVLSNRSYTVERAVVTEMASQCPAACGPLLRAALALPASRYSQVNAVEFMTLADACLGKTVEVAKRVEVVEPMKFDDDATQPSEGE